MAPTGKPPTIPSRLPLADDPALRERLVHFIATRDRGGNPFAALDLPRARAILARLSQGDLIMLELAERDRSVAGFTSDYDPYGR